VLAWSASAGIALQQQSVLLHQAEDALGVDGLASGGSPLALEERGDPPVAIGGPLVDEVFCEHLPPHRARQNIQSAGQSVMSALGQSPSGDLPTGFFLDRCRSRHRQSACQWRLRHFRFDDVLFSKDQFEPWTTRAGELLSIDRMERRPVFDEAGYPAGSRPMRLCY